MNKGGDKGQVTMPFVDVLYQNTVDNITIKSGLHIDNIFSIIINRIKMRFLR